MPTPWKARRVRVYTTEYARGAGGKPLVAALLELLRSRDALGATALRAADGFGASGRRHGGGLVDAAPELPVVVEWIDRPERVARVLPEVLALCAHGLVTVDETEVALHEPHPVRELRAGVTVGEVMTREVRSVPPAAPVREVVEAMLGRTYRAVPVVEDGRPVGIITNSDLVLRAGLGVRLELAARLAPEEVRGLLGQLGGPLTARDAMTPEPVTVSPETPLPRAAELMARRRLKRLPVVDGAGRLVGMVSRVDLLRTAAAGLAETAPTARELGLSGDEPLSAVMRRDAPTVRPETPLAEVFQAVTATRLNRALVVDADRRVVGIVSDAELLERVTPALRPGAVQALMRRLPFLHAVGDAAHARGRTAADVMSHAFARAPETMLLTQGIEVMLQTGAKVLAVTDAEGRLAGLVDRADLLHGLLRGGLAAE
jgi:CBS domain-containing protein